MTRASRRRFVRVGARALAGAALVDPLDALARVTAQPICGEAGDPGELVGVVPLHGSRGRKTPFGTMVGGSGLDARLFTDLSTLEPDRLVTPTAHVFVRTAASSRIADRQRDWTIASISMAGTVSHLDAADLRRDARPMGPHLIECAGNSDPDNFGLMSVAEWTGVPLVDVLARSGWPPAPASGTARPFGVLVSGVDDESGRSGRSIPGASWILPIDGLDRLGAFLAVAMNGEPLPLDHGAPVRLVVPGWYGCAWIKWVDALRLVAADEPATSQMREFAARTHQAGVPALAREYEAPVIDFAAMPVRVEKRRLPGRLEYRIVGIAWGGERAPEQLTIRFDGHEPPTRFALCPQPSTSSYWSLWEYRWRPSVPGTYEIVVKSADPTIRTRRLDLSFYLRRVRIDEV